MCASEGKAPAAPARMLLFARALRIWGATLGVGARLRVLERPPFFRFEAFSCWNFIEFMSNFYGAGLQKSH